MLHQVHKPAVESLRRSLSNVSISSRCSYDNIDQNGDTFQEISPTHQDRNEKAKSIKRNFLNQHSVQVDTISTNSSATLRTDSYRQAHPLQSFAFDYPKRPLLAQTRKSNGHDNRQKLNGNKHYEISV